MTIAPNAVLEPALVFGPDPIGTMQVRILHRQQCAQLTTAANPVSAGRGDKGRADRIFSGDAVRLGMVAPPNFTPARTQAAPPGAARKGLTGARLPTTAGQAAGLRSIQDRLRAAGL